LDCEQNFWPSLAVLLLLDEPTTGLSPLHAYLVLSMLANHARNCGRIVILSMERPRSDVFPFLDRVAILCLGDVVYAGRTTLLLDYFQRIGFPCSELENPLMYYREWIAPALYPVI
jgi:ATP-binding cassette, subfamily G (WHITE), member 5 (sterolin 1)